MRVLNRSWSDDRRSIAVILLAQPHSRPSVTSETCAADRRKIASLANFVGAIIDQCRADGRCPMSGKSRYGSSFGSSNRHHAAEETRSTAAATVATDAAVQASWAQYVQNLVSEQIAALHDGVIEGVVDRSGGYLYSKEIRDIYSTQEPQQQFDKRIKFTIDIQQQAVKALKELRTLGGKIRSEHE